MVRSLILAVVLGWAGQSFAGVVCQEFSYQNSSKFSLTLSVDGSPVTLSGYLRFGDKVTVQQGLVSAEFKSYRQESSVVSAIINVEGQNIEGQKMSNLCLFDDVTLEVLTKNAIPEPRASMASSLEKLLAKLKEKDVKGWSTAQTFAWMADINKRTPGKQLFQYFDKVELGDVKLPRPEPRGSAGNTASVQTPSIPANPRALDPQALENPQYPMTPQQEQAYRQPGRPMPIGPDGEDNNDDDGIAPPVRRPYPQYSNDDEGARRRNWELARRQEWERQRRRGQPPGFQPPGFGWGQQNGGMYPPEPQQYQRQYPQERGGGRPQQDGYGNNYDPGIPQPPQRRQPGFFQGLFGGN